MAEAEAFFAEDHPIAYRWLLLQRKLGALLCRLGLHRERDVAIGAIHAHGWWWKCERHGCKHQRHEWSNP